MDARVNKDMIISDMLQIDPGIAAVLMASGMHCVGCPASQGESLEEAAMVHGLNADERIENVNGIQIRYLPVPEARAPGSMAHNVLHNKNGLHTYCVPVCHIRS